MTTGAAATHQHQEIRQRDDGLWQIGIDDAGPGPFETREFAMSVAGFAPPSIPLRKTNGKEARFAGST
jgi:hypothetical protein